MASRRDDDDSELNDRDLPDESDMDDEEAGDTDPCPYCGQPLYDQAEVCPHCGSYISFEDAPRPKPRWLVVAVIVCLLIVLIAWVATGRS